MFNIKSDSTKFIHSVQRSVRDRERQTDRQTDRQTNRNTYLKTKGKKKRRIQKGKRGQRIMRMMHIACLSIALFTFFMIQIWLK